MIKMIKTLKKGLDKTLETVIILIIALLVLTVLLQVVCRTVARIVNWLILHSADGGGMHDSLLTFLSWWPQCTWTSELSKIMLIWGSLLGAAVAYSEKSHLGIDFVTEKLPDKLKNAVAAFMHLSVGATAGYILVYGGINLMNNAFNATPPQVTSSMKICWGYIYLVLPVSGIFFIIYAFQFIFFFCQRVISREGGS